MIGGSLRVLLWVASSTTKTGRSDIAEILLKVAINTINQIKSLVLLDLYLMLSSEFLSNMAPNAPEKNIQHTVFLIINSERYGILCNKKACIVRAYGTTVSIIL
jgi:hypothetical protein